MRQSLYLKKIGMTQFLRGDVFEPVTVLKYVTNKVLFVKDKSVCGYSSAVVGVDELPENKIRKLSKSQYGVFKKGGNGYFRKLYEIRSDDALPNVGDVLSLDAFSSDKLVDVTGVSRGKGFAGAMKKYGFAGGRASHGNSLSHRVLGSTGNRTDPGRVFKNKKMPSHMGDVRVTKQNLKIVEIDIENQLLLVKGGVPGGVGCYVLVRDAIKS